MVDFSKQEKKDNIYYAFHYKDVMTGHSFKKSDKKKMDGGQWISTKRNTAPAININATFCSLYSG